MTRQPDDSEPGRGPPDYVIVVAASDWIKDRYPAASLIHALQADQNRHREPEPDLEAEP